MTPGERASRRLMRGVRKGNLRMVEESLAAGADPNYVESVVGPEDGYGRPDEEETPVLYAACEGKNVQIVQLLLDHGADPKACHGERTLIDSSTTPCLFAALPEPEIVEDPGPGIEKIEVGMVVAVPVAGGGPIRRFRGRPDQVQAALAIVEALLRKGADPNCPSVSREDASTRSYLADDHRVRAVPELLRLLRSFGAPR